jgi:hypothetical protein
MKNIYPVLGLLFVLPVWAVNVPLTVQEALYPGDFTGTTYSGGGGVARTNEPFCMGVPLADSAGITNPQTLTLTGATAAQFRTLGVWPSGHLKWVQVCGVLSSLTAGGTATVTLADGGSGNFPTGNLASINGSTITINTTGGTCGQTGVTCFTVKAGANFNVVDTVTIGTTTVVASSSSATRGLVLVGPNPTAAYPANVTCGSGAGQSPCTTVYSSANDPASACTIEQNGPVMAGLRCVGTHYDNAGHPYMHYTARLYFYRGKNFVKVTSVLRNADYNSTTDSGGNTFDSAFKGFQSYELRIAPNISGTLQYTVAADSTACTAGVCTGTMSGSDSVFIYQGQSSLMAQQADCNATCMGTFTPDIGYVVSKNTTTLALNSDGSQTPGAFYADVKDSSGVGVEIGVYQGGSNWPKSLEFNGGGTDARIGIWPRENSQAVYQAWPTWSISDLYLNFHASNPASLASEFLKFQHYLVMRADRTYYNSTSVFPYPMPDSTHEDNFYNSTWAAASYADGTKPLAGGACCTLDVGTQDSYRWPLEIYRYKYWPNPGPPNQEEFRWSNMLRFLRTGQTGRLIDSMHFYRMEAGNSWPHADGTSPSDSTVNNFHWRGQASGQLDGFGRPTIACGGIAPGDGCSTLQNSLNSFVDWYDTLHFHWWGILDYYFLTGDETTHDAIVPVKDWYMNPNTYQGGTQGGIGIIRGIGIEILSASKLSDFLAATGDSDSSAVLAQGTTNYTLFVKPEGCMSGYPAGCTMPPAEPAWPYTYPSPDPPGVSRSRGAPASTQGRGPGRCTADGDNGGLTAKGYRGISSFYASLLVEGLLALTQSQGSGWTEYNTARDLAYGISQWAFAEQFYDDGGSYFYKAGGISPTRAQDSFYNGFTYSATYDLPYTCPAGTPVVAGVTAQYATGGPVYDLLQGSVFPLQGMFMLFYMQGQMNGSITPDQVRRFQIALDWIRGQQGQNGSDLGQYQPASVFEMIDEPSNIILQDVPFTLTSLGSGKYSLAWAVPSGIQAARLPSPYRIKWSPRIIAPSTPGTYPGFGRVNGLLNYDAVNTGTFGLSPATYSTWFGANNTVEPAALAPGQSQSFTIDTGGVTGLTAQNFSVKAYIQSQGSQGGPGPATHFTISGYPNPDTAGTSHTITVTALDANNNVASGYTGTVRITSSDAAAILPPNYAFQTSDAGVHAFAVTLNTVQTGLSITATDTTTVTITGSQTGIQVVSGGTSPASKLLYYSGNNQQAAITSGALNWTTPATTGTPGATGYNDFTYDPLSRQSYIWANIPGSTSIYATDLYTYNSTTHAFTHLGGTGSMGNACPLDTPTQPGDRHPGLGFFLDAIGNRMVIVGGVDQLCTGTGGNGSPRADQYFQYLHSTPSLDWHLATPNTLPGQLDGTAAIVQDTTHNVFFKYGGSDLLHNHWLYCPSYANPTAGVLTAAQTSVGCNAASTDNWVEVTNISCSGADCADHYNIPGVWGPLGTNYTGLLYVPAIDRFIQFAGENGSATISYTYTFSAKLSASGGQPAVAWTEIGLSGNPTNEYPSGPGGWINQPAWALTPNGIYYHQAKGANAPQDWLLNLATGSWTNLGNSGGPTTDTLMTYDASTNRLIAQAGTTATPAIIWEGSLSGGGAAGQPLPNPLVVEVTDANNNPVSGVPVTFAVTAGGGTLTGGVTQLTVNTNSQGLASTTLTVGATAGTNTVTATSGTLTGSPVVFTATSGGGSQSNSCDLNADGVVNAVDVQLAINQALGIAPCTNADLIGNGVCSVLDVQRIINAANGGVCRVGP